ncbi:MAG: hypothetical protein KZQ94_08525 [Candidatus Thiodiazotropha sp. (ex Troendleina suluensis)]|nr:hypothetical protein [Candidatus Thiodiazotropha sp. (ex Troendleina suluensis)]
MKERKKITEITITESAEVCSIKTSDDGMFSLMDSDEKLVSHIQYESVGYERDSGKPKILRSIARDADDLVGDNPWKKYKKIGFVDTNSVVENEQKLFVSSSSLLLWKDENRRFGNVHHVNLLVGYCSKDINPERIAWADFIRRIQASKLLESSDRMLIVVDSEKSLIPSINKRREPVVDGFLLPNEFTFAYATSDAGAENWINKEMKRRDTVAGRVLPMVKMNKELLQILAKNEKLYIKNDFEQSP